MFLDFDFNGFWRENDVIRLTAKVVFHLWRKKLELLKELTEMSSNVKKVFVKLNWLKSY